MKQDKNMLDEISRVAYDLYVKRGYAPGNDFADWLEAEKIVMKNYSKGIPSAVKAVKTSQPMRAKAKTGLMHDSA
jgi:hypothetical protein